MMPSPAQARSDARWMQQALVLADTADALDEVPVGAVVVLGDTVIGRGHNRTRIDRDPTAHAEVVAVRDAARCRGSHRLDTAVLYVTIEPCLMCCGALLQARLGRLVFGAREPRTGAVVSAFDTLMSPGHTHHVTVSEGVEAVACQQRMQAFFARRRQR